MICCTQLVGKVRCHRLAYVPPHLATSTFTVTVTDANGFTGSQGFQVSVAAPVFGGGSYVFIS